MVRRPPISQRADTLFPSPTHFRASGRSWSAKMCATAAGFSASAARPYTVSVGSPITAPARKAATALASSVVWADVGMAVRDRTAGFSKCPSILQRNQQPQQQVDQNSGKRRRQDRYDDVEIGRAHV